MEKPLGDESLSLTRRLGSEAETLALAAALGRRLIPGLVIFLRGDLGSGKTTFVRGMLRGLGYRDRVKSPTYTLVELYTVSSLYLYHFDFYRLDDPHGWIDAGLREHFTPHTVCLVEWPEKAAGTLPAADIVIALTISGEQQRDIAVTAHSPAGRRCLEGLTV